LARKSPLGYKKRRFDATFNPPDMDMRSEGEDEDHEMALLPTSLPPPRTCDLVFDPLQPVASTQAPADLSTRMQHSVDHLEAASQAVRLRIAGREQSDKSTTVSYERHINSYVTWWDTYQASVVGANPTHVAIAAFPVMAVKATMFLEYTSTRPKVGSPPSSLCCDFSENGQSISVSMGALK